MSRDQVRRLVIDGHDVDPADRGRREIRSPHDGSVVRVVVESTADDAREAVAEARAAFDEGPWPRTSWADRAALLDRVADLLEKDAERIALLETEDTAKRLVESEYDVADVVSVFRFYAGVPEPAPRHVDVDDDGVDSRVAVEPAGVAALITPWNYPLLQTSWKVAPALLAGCTFVLKPSELTPSTAVRLVELLEEAGLPDGVANVVLGSGSVVGAALVEDPRVDVVSFTGGLVTGRRIMAAAAATVKKVALELGGKNPNIIFADADLDAAIDNAVSYAYIHSGQVCSAGTRLLVQRSVHDRVVDELVRRADAIVLGGPSDADAETGPLISAAHLEKVEAYLAVAVGEGAVLRAGGVRPHRSIVAAWSLSAPDGAGRM